MTYVNADLERTRYATPNISRVDNNDPVWRGSPKRAIKIDAAYGDRKSAIEEGMLVHSPMKR